MEITQSQLRKLSKAISKAVAAGNAMMYSAKMADDYIMIPDAYAALNAACVMLHKAGEIVDELTSSEDLEEE